MRRVAHDPPRRQKFRPISSEDATRTSLASGRGTRYLDNFGQRQSLSYDLTEQVNVYFEALDLTNAVHNTHGRFSEQLLDVVAYGCRFAAGVYFRL